MDDTEALELDDILIAIIDEFAALPNPSADDVDRLANQHPEHASQLRTLLGTLVVLEDVDPNALKQNKHTESNSHLRSIGDFKLLREVGRGGMGVVYEARQQSIDRRVALKLLPFAALSDPQRLKRFQNEVRAAGTLHHSNIIPIFSVGVERGLHYFAMQFIDGPSLEDLLDGLRARNGEPHSIGQETELYAKQSTSKQPPQTSVPSKYRSAHVPSLNDSETVREIAAGVSTLRVTTPNEYFRTVAEWGVQVASALTHAHENGIVHRDIKPGNLLLNEHGQAWVADFGLARLEQDVSLTMTGDLLGTLKYMAPEQALGKHVLIDHRADIYSLGATLYELLTLQPVLTGGNREEILSELAFSQPSPLTQHDPTIPTDLETIVLRALEKNPADRFESASAFGEELRLFLDNKPLTIRPIGVLGRASRYCRQRPRLIASLAAMLLFVAVSSLTALAIALQSRATLIEREKELADAVAAERAERERANRNLRLAKAAVDDWYVEFAQGWLKEQKHGLGLDAQRARLLEKAAQFYDQYANQAANSEVSLDRAVTLKNLAVVKHTLGNLDEAKQIAIKPIGLLKELASKSPNEVESHVELAIARGNLSRMQGLEQGLMTLETSIAELDIAPPSVKAESKWRFEKVRTCRALAASAWGTGDMPKADKYIQMALELNNNLIVDAPENLDYQRQRSRILETQITIRMEWLKGFISTGRLRPEFSHENTSKLAEDALQIAESWVEKEPHSWEAKTNLVTFVTNSYDWLPEETREQQLLRTVEIAEQRAAAFPDVASKDQVRWCVDKLEYLYRKRREHEKGLQAARKMFDHDTKKHGDTANRWHMDDYGRIGVHCRELQRFDEAIQAFRSQIEVRQQILAQSKEVDATLDLREAKAYQNLGGTEDRLAGQCLDKGDTSNGVKWAEAGYGHLMDSLRLFRELRSADDKDSDLLVLAHIAADCEVLARKFYQLERKPEANLFVKRALTAAMDGLLQRGKDVTSLFRIAHLLVSWPDLEIRNYGRSLQTIDRIIEVAPEELNKHTIWFLRGLAYCELRDWDRCVECLNKSIELAKARNSLDLKREYFALAVAYHHLGNDEEAKRWYADGVDWLESNHPNEELRQLQEPEVENLYLAARELLE